MRTENPAIVEQMIKEGQMKDKYKKDDFEM
jgi:hypothetical protein